jgi:ketosteroid isomerase-like protein
MIRNRNLTAIAAGALVLAAAPAAMAQSNTTTQEPSQQQERIGAILGALFGDRLGVTTSVEAQWAAGRRPLQTQRAQFNTRIDAEVRSGAVSRADGDRLKAEYDEVVALETRYGADGRFTTQERNELADRYGAITQALSDGGYANGSGSTTLNVAAGRAEFDRRVDAAVSARRLSRTEGTRLKTEYASLVTVEAGYARDGISARERDDLDARLDALDARVGDTNYGGGNTVVDNRTRLSNIERAVPNAGLSSTARAQLLVEHGDLVRLEAAYSRSSPSADDRAYLERRITDLETRARVRR